MKKEVLVELLKNLGKHLALETLNYIDENFDKLELPATVAPFVKLLLDLVKKDLSKTDGVLNSLHQFDIK